MSIIPYSVSLSVTAALNSLIEASYQIPSNQEFSIDDVIITSTGIFNLVGLRNSDGLNFANISENSPMPSTHLKNGANSNDSINPFQFPLVLKEGRTLYITFKDTSGVENDIYLTLVGKRTIPNS